MKALAVQLHLIATPWTIAPRPLCPWDSPVKNTGVGCHFLLQGIFQTQGWSLGLLCCGQTIYHLSHQGSPYTIDGKVKVAQLCLTLCDPMDSPWNSPGQNTGGGSCSLLQGIFPIQGSNPHLPHCRQTIYHLSHQGRSRILEWVTIFPTQELNWGSSIAGGFFTELPGNCSFLIFNIICYND